MIASIMITIGATPLFNITPGTAAIALDGLNCVGTECHLIDCPHFPFRRNYFNYSMDVGVRCVLTLLRPGVS